MELEKYSDSHLTYCTNIHPGEKWTDHFHELKTHLPELKKRLSPDKPFGVGLRLSAVAASELLKNDQLQTFRAWLHEEDLYLFTMNGFPYGSFHHEKVKDNVYKPDWSSHQRLSYTLDLVRILAGLLPDYVDGGISTSPVTYKYWQRGPQEMKQLIEKSCHHLAETAFEMHKHFDQAGKELHLDIEPEPDCLIENSTESIHFFQNQLWPIGSRYLSDQKGIDEQEAVNILKKHIRLCYDTCHFAVEFEEPAEAVKRLRDAGIRIGKVQISAALKVDLASSDMSRLNMHRYLQEYVESTYLHQVVEKVKDGSLHQYRDLPDALRHIEDQKAVEWRIHFHVPIFTGKMENLNSTQDHIIKGIRPLFEESGCRHFEIETYTWEVLPESLKLDIVDSIEREYRWLLENLNSNSA
jgi:hypothetical protein